MFILKELIDQFHTLFDNFQKDKEEPKESVALSTRTYYLEDTHKVRNGETVRIEIGRRRHIADIIDIERKGYEGLTPWGYSALETDMLRSNKSLYFIVYHKQTPIAFLGSRLENRDIHITNVAVIPDWQMQGIGKYLLEQLVHVAKVEHATSLSLEVRVSNVKAQALYSKMGFETIRLKKNYYHGDNEDALDMQFPIPENVNVIDEE